MSKIKKRILESWEEQSFKMNQNKNEDESWKEQSSEFPPKTIQKIKRSKTKIEQKLKVKIKIRANNIEIQGEQVDIYVAEKVCQAIDRNFPINVALLLTNQEYILEDIHIKSIRKTNVETIKARIIGTKGKTLKALSELSEGYITLHNNTVSIISHADKIKDTITAIKNLIRGSKQSNVLSYLRRTYKEQEEDLGLKE